MMNKIMVVILCICALIFRTDSAWAESGWLDLGTLVNFRNSDEEHQRVINELEIRPCSENKELCVITTVFVYKNEQIFIDGYSEQDAQGNVAFVYKCDGSWENGFSYNSAFKQMAKWFYSTNGEICYYNSFENNGKRKGLIINFGDGCHGPVESYTIPEYNWLSANQFFDSYPNVKVNKPSDMEIIEHENARIVVRNRVKDQEIVICDYENNYIKYEKERKMYIIAAKIIAILVPTFLIAKKLKDRMSKIKE